MSSSPRGMSSPARMGSPGTGSGGVTVQVSSSGSGNSGNSKDFEDYIQEVQDIDKGRNDSGDDDSAYKTPDGKETL